MTRPAGWIVSITPLIDRQDIPRYVAERQFTSTWLDETKPVGISEKEPAP